MKPQVVFYSRSTTDEAGNKSEFGIQGTIEEGEGLDTAYQAVQHAVIERLAPTGQELDETILAKQQELKNLTSEAQQLETYLNLIKEFAEKNGINLDIPKRTVEAEETVTEEPAKVNPIETPVLATPEQINVEIPAVAPLDATGQV